MSTRATAKIWSGIGTGLAALAFAGGCASADPGADGAGRAAWIDGDSADAEQTGIVASGTGTVRVHPDSARVTVGVDERSATVEEAQRRVNETMAGVLAGLRALGIPSLELRTTLLNVQPVHETQPAGGGTGKIVAYDVSSSVSVTVRKVPFEALAGHASAILDAAIHAGANVIGGFELFVDDPASAQAEALEDAVKDARRSAEIMAKAAGVEITGVASISEQSAGVQFAMQASPGFGGGLATSVEAGDLTVSSQVSVTFTFR